MLSLKPSSQPNVFAFPFVEAYEMRGILFFFRYQNCNVSVVRCSAGSRDLIYGSFPKLGVLYSGVLIIRILLFRVLY